MLTVNLDRFKLAIKNCTLFCDGGGTYGKFIHIFITPNTLNIVGGENTGQARIVNEQIAIESSDTFDKWIPADLISEVSKTLRGETCELITNENGIMLKNGFFKINIPCVNLPASLIQTLTTLQWDNVCEADANIANVLSTLAHIAPREGIPGSRAILIANNKALSYNSMCFALLKHSNTYTQNIIIPKNFVRYATILDRNGAYKVCKSENWHRLMNQDRVVYIGKEMYPVDARYLQVDEKISFRYEITINNRDDLITELNKMEAAKSRDLNHIVKIKVFTDHLDLGFENDSSQAFTKIPITSPETIPDGYQFLISIQWLIDAAKACTGAELKMKLQESQAARSVLLTDGSMTEIVTIIINGEN
ncbi:MAG: hypothetical protein WBK76_00630 [Candidatus Saccharimonadales bacterium]